MASLENNRPQSTSGLRRKSKGKKKVSETTGTQSQKFAEVGMLDALGRLVIAPAETNGFFPSIASMEAIIDSIKSFYHDAWISWGEMPVFDREKMWNHFREKKKERTVTCEKHVKRKRDGYSTLVEPHVERTNVGHKKGLDEWRQSQPASEDDSSKQSPDDDEASQLPKKKKKSKALSLGSPHCAGCIVYGMVSASLNSPDNEYQEEIDSLQRQVQELSKKQKADRLRFASLENLVRHLIEDCRPEESDDDD